MPISDAQAYQFLVATTKKEYKNNKITISSARFQKELLKRNCYQKIATGQFFIGMHLREEEKIAYKNAAQKELFYLDIATQLTILKSNFKAYKDKINLNWYSPNERKLSAKHNFIQKKRRSLNIAEQTHHPSIAGRVAVNQFERFSPLRKGLALLEASALLTVLLAAGISLLSLSPQSISSLGVLFVIAGPTCGALLYTGLDPNKQQEFEVDCNNQLPAYKQELQAQAEKNLQNGDEPQRELVVANDRVLYKSTVATPAEKKLQPNQNGIVM